MLLPTLDPPILAQMSGILALVPSQPVTPTYTQKLILYLPLKAPGLVLKRTPPWRVGGGAATGWAEKEAWTAPNNSTKMH